MIIGDNKFKLYLTYQLVEMKIIYSHDLPFVAELCDVFVLKELYSGQPWAGHSELNRVTPNLPLVRHGCPHIVQL